MTTNSDDWSLDQIRSRQEKFLDALEKEVKDRPDELIDPVAIGAWVGLDAILTGEFIFYWVRMGRLDKQWDVVAKQIQKQVSHSPIKLPKGMIPRPPEREKQERKNYSEPQ